MRITKELKRYCMYRGRTAATQAGRVGVFFVRLFNAYVCYFDLWLCDEIPDAEKYCETEVL